MAVRKTLVFIVTEDWFFVSHFLPMLRAARRAGFEPLVLTRVRNHATAIEEAGGRVISLEADRRSLNPVAILRSLTSIVRVLRRERPTLVHCIALRSIIVGGAAARLARVPALILALTGGGFLTARTDLVSRGISRAIAILVRGAFARRDTRFLFENEEDPAIFGLRATDLCVTIVGGAGVDPDFYQPTWGDREGTLRIALVSRMLWSKGVDIAVEATAMARSRGAAVELSLYGAPDVSNPRAVPEATLRNWSRREGITWHGATSDVRQVWTMHDVACLPSRGGEGLPRTLLEAAACGRALVTTAVPGCGSFVRDGVDGLVVRPDDPAALADAFVRLAKEPELVGSMQRSARARVHMGYTEAAVSSAVEAMYREIVIRA